MTIDNAFAGLSPSADGIPSAIVPWSRLPKVRRLPPVSIWRSIQTKGVPSSRPVAMRTFRLALIEGRHADHPQHGRSIASEGRREARFGGYPNVPGVPPALPG